ncbi:MAG: extracellular solute-binding protein [bacterium]|jgi:ABC-type Fe3+ transport system substrate-binding protein
MRRFAIILFFLIAAIPFLLMPGRHGAQLPKGNANESLTIISPHRREVRLEYSRGFAEWMNTRYHRNVAIQWLDVGGASKVMKELESRYASSPGNPGVDLMFGGGIAPFLTAIQKNWLNQTELPAKLLSDIPATCAGSPVLDPGQRWFGVTLSAFGILYNRPLVQRLGLPVPVSWHDLARPEYYSWVGSGDPRSSGSVHMCYEIILQSYGFEKGWPIITRICANVRGFGEAGGTVPREVAAGDIAAGMVIDQYAQTVIKSVGNDALALVLPEKETIIGPDPIAMLRGAKQPELAKLFIEFTLSEEGQRLLYQSAGTNGQKHNLYRMPVLKALYAEAAAPKPNPYDFPSGLAYDNELATRRWNILNDLMGVWLIDAHADLKIAWKDCMNRDPGLAEELCRPPLTEKSLEALIPIWKDSRRKQEVMQQWSKEAQLRYLKRSISR